MSTYIEKETVVEKPTPSHVTINRASDSSNWWIGIILGIVALAIVGFFAYSSGQTTTPSVIKEKETIQVPHEVTKTENVYVPTPAPATPAPNVNVHVEQPSTAPAPKSDSVTNTGPSGDNQSTTPSDTTTTPDNSASTSSTSN